MSGWKPPAIPDINEKSVLAVLTAIKEIIEMREGMRLSKEAVGFVKVKKLSECPAGRNCIDSDGNVLIRGSLFVNDVQVTGVSDTLAAVVARATITGRSDIYIKKDLGAAYDIFARKTVQGVNDIFVQKAVQGVSDILAKKEIQGVYDIILEIDVWGDGDTWGDSDVWGVF